MARILFAWELGWRLSHLSNVAMVSQRLAEENHEVALAARELQSAHRFFTGTRVQYYQAPFKQGPAPALRAHLSYAHLLYTSGYADPRELAVLLSAWIGILGSFRPEVVVFDHSPTALLASRAMDVKRVLIGSGFLIPPAGSPLGVFPDTPKTPEVLRKLEQDEAAVLAVINRAVSALGIAPLSRLEDLYGIADERCLLSFPELDPFEERADSEYHGVWPVREDGVPTWPDVEGPRVFAYLSAFPGCPALLQALSSAKAAVLVYGPGIPPEMRQGLCGDRLVFVDDLVDLDEAGCDLFVSHGGHTSVARTLLKGIPQLMIPNYREQLFTARRVRDLGAGLVLDRECEDYSEPLGRILDDRTCREAANEFARRHRSFDARDAATRVADKVRPRGLFEPLDG